MLNAAAYALSKKFTANTADTLGSLVGAPCTIKSITRDVQNNMIVEFEWTGTSGAKQQQQMIIPAGVSVTGFTPVDDTHFKWNYSDGTFSDVIKYPLEQIRISAEPGNALTEKEDGLFVSSTGVEISQEEDNAIETKGDGLFVKKTNDVKISQEADNAIEEKEDGIYVKKSDDVEISEEEKNILEKKDDGYYVPDQLQAAKEYTDDSISTINVADAIIVDALPSYDDSGEVPVVNYVKNGESKTTSNMKTWFYWENPVDGKVNQTIFIGGEEMTIKVANEVDFSEYAKKADFEYITDDDLREIFKEV